MIKLTQKGDFHNTEKFIKKVLGEEWVSILDKYGREGVDALSNATPKDTSLTASSWSYGIRRNGDNISLEWYNSNRNKGVSIVIILQYGHATGTGGYVEGIDYINPALQPVFEELAERVWKEVTSI